MPNRKPTSTKKKPMQGKTIPKKTSVSAKRKPTVMDRIGSFFDKLPRSSSAPTRMEQMKAYEGYLKTGKYNLKRIKKK